MHLFISFCLRVFLVDTNSIDVEDEVEVEPETQCIAHKLIAAWSSCDQAKHVEDEVQKIYEQSLIYQKGSVKTRKRRKIQYHTNFWNQVRAKLLTSTYILNLHLIFFSFFGFLGEPASICFVIRTVLSYN